MSVDTTGFLLSGPAAFLRVLKGEDQGKGWELDSAQKYTFGRSRKCNLRVNDRTVSATHAHVECRDDVWRIRDLGSTHGTRVNHMRVEDEKPLFDRDVIRLGKTVLEFREYEHLDPDDLEQIEKGLEMEE